MNLSSALRAAAVFAVGAISLFGQKPVLTEDFESGKIDSAVWEKRVIGAPTAEVEAADGAHGKYALHVHFPDAGDRNAYAFIVATHLPDSVRTHYFGRAYVKISPSVGNTHNPFIFTGEPGYPLSKFQEIGSYRSTWQPSYQENKSLAGQGRGEVPFHSVLPVPVDKWFLLEWEFNDDPTTIAMWIDGEPSLNTVGTDKVDVLKFTWPRNGGNSSNLVGGYQEFGFGLRVWGLPNPAMDVYYDDIAISTTRIGPVK